MNVRCLETFIFILFLYISYDNLFFLKFCYRDWGLLCIYYGSRLIHWKWKIKWKKWPFFDNERCIEFVRHNCNKNILNWHLKCVLNVLWKLCRIILKLNVIIIDQWLTDWLNYIINIFRCFSNYKHLMRYKFLKYRIYTLRITTEQLLLSHKAWD